MNKGSLNRAVLIGRLGRDPQVRYTPTGTPITSFSVATTQVFKNKEGKLVQNTDWHRVVAWSRLAEVCGQYLKKGSLVCVEGPMKTRRWDDKSGGKHALTEVVAETMQMLGHKNAKPSESEGVQEEMEILAEATA
ncbi:single-stranded DNA-binding protein [bacterium]|nr:single-stranded DNA-binding protein [bacterium]